ncbi:hypothetical protein IAR55_004013 [Kwoniella newhampshirensis]|uniref:Calcofluor white hypersensitive protein n=1 Tax=Kwoniella newhampshirensis TaxID=1651941 RepID=A0AAW0YXW9_9TREE
MTTLLAFPARWIPLAHTTIASLAFSSALALGWLGGLWKELCINSVARWPVEWFPSVSATIGDHALPRAPFQILIALCATPRFLLLLVQWLVHREPPLTPAKSSARHDTAANGNGHSTSLNAEDVRMCSVPQRPGERIQEEVGSMTESMVQAIETEIGSSALADLELLVGVARTFCCGGWVYITSRDHHDIHDLFMILYLLLTLPWMTLSTRHCTHTKSKRKRRIPFYGFLATILPLVWLYYRHSVMRIPGAYTYYAMLEWSLVFWDLTFDALVITELADLQIAIVDTSGPAGHSPVAATSHKHPQSILLAQPLMTGTKAKKSVADWTFEGTIIPSPYWRGVAAWISDVYYAICFWTVFTSLGFQLFYWSVWKLELALVANLSGYTLASASSYAYVTSQKGLLTHRALLVLCGMGCYFFPWPAARLLGVSLGTWTGWLSLFGTWARLRGSEEVLAEGQRGWNKAGLVLACLSLLEYWNRPLDLHPAQPLDPSEKKEGPESLDFQLTTTQQRLITVGLGALIHLVQTFVTDAGTIISWTWTGYPVKGPTLHPFAGVVIAAAATGVLSTHNVLGPVWTSVGCISATMLYCFPDWAGYFGGTILVAYLTSIIPAYLRVASACSPASTFGNALLINIILDVLSVITAAYAFVPMGWLLRERTDLILGFCMMAVAAGSQAAGRPVLPAGQRLPLRSHRRIKSTARWTLFTSGLLSVMSIATGYSKLPATVPSPYYPDHKIFTGGIWTVHFGVDKEGRDSQRRMMELIKDMQVDVVGLLETDLHRFVYGNRDLTRVLSEQLGYYVDLGPGPNKHTWGAALLSKFPILNSTHYLLPSPHGELAPAIFATLDVHGEKVNVMVSHNGQEEDILDRELQTTQIARLLRETEDTPTVFLGYLVTRTGDLRPWPYQILMEDGRMFDIEIDDRWRWCEYIAFRGLWRIGYARVHESDISDTELQVGKFLLPKAGAPVRYESNKEIYWHIGEHDIPEPWRMPRMFRGNGTRGHRYVVWDGPLYYLPPERSGLQRYGWGWATEM